MFSYIAAVATAVTVFIASAPVAEVRQSTTKPPVASRGNVPTVTARIANDSLPGAAIFDTGRNYKLSIAEQRTLQRALFRSVRFIDGLS